MGLTGPVSRISRETTGKVPTENELPVMVGMQEDGVEDLGLQRDGEPDAPVQKLKYIYLCLSGARI